MEIVYSITVDSFVINQLMWKLVSAFSYIINWMHLQYYQMKQMKYAFVVV